MNILRTVSSTGAAKSDVQSETQTQAMFIASPLPSCVVAALLLPPLRTNTWQPLGLHVCYSQTATEAAVTAV